MSRTLVTDLYELNMAASYLRRGMTAPATFVLSVRALPPTRGFAVAAGLEDCLDYLESFAFTEEDVAWMESHGLGRDLAERLAAVRFTGDVRAVPEGTVVLADEPILEVTAPLPEAQLVESYLLNQVTHQSAIATKAVRCRIAAGDTPLYDFSLRRTHGVDASMAVARLSAIAGFAGTSNVEAARRFGLRAVGTMAHSYVEAFPNEHEAFRAFVEDIEGPCTFLVDTYDTIEGVSAAADVVRELDLPEGRQLAVRLDSGDLVALAKDSRRVLDEAGLHRVRIFVSGALDEYSLERIRASGAPVDGAGVGTRLGVSADAPYLDTVYKPVVLDGRPVTKLSSGKESLPGAKQIWRRPGAPDLLSLDDEDGPEVASPLLEPVLAAGRRIRPAATIADARAHVEQGLSWLPPEARRIHAPQPPPVVLSDALRTVSEETVRQLIGARTGEPRDS